MNLSDMEKDRIGIIGVGAGSAIVVEMAKRTIEREHEVIVIGNPSESLLKPESLPFVITRMPEFYFPDIDPKAFNYKKHKRTCEKNRRNRKKRK